jgi:threonyl-tRNA synthetase
MTIINELKEFWRQEHKKAGYVEVQTPMILNKQLWEQSGHWDHYKENMYFTKIDNQDFAVKPMNCPGGMLVYKSTVHSYRDFPLRVGEMGLVHRHELSGVISGLFRVRAFTQDDAHIFMEKSQIQSEIINVIELVDRFYKIFGFEYHVELSTKPDKAMGDPKVWEIAEKALEEALKKKKMNYKINPGDGAFYGPKIDFHIKDCLGRTWQCATIQLDFSMPEKFDLTYEGKDGKKHRPVMIHRVVYGSIDRFFGILIEHFAGKFPLWLAPEQIRVITVADRFNKYAEKIVDQLNEQGLRVYFAF